jgi:hypothetical protein
LKLQNTENGKERMSRTRQDIEADPEYKIVIACSEYLVPDVCGMIMAELEDIHTNLSRQRWKERISQVNREYKKVERGNDGGYFSNAGYACNSFYYSIFIFNWRVFPDDIHIHRGITNKNTNRTVAMLPANY